MPVLQGSRLSSKFPSDSFGPSSSIIGGPVSLADHRVSIFPASPTLAIATRRSDISIEQVIGMPFGTSSFASTHKREIPPQSILMVGDSFLMGGVHATSMAAKVINCKTIWDIANLKFRRDSMSLLEFVVNAKGTVPLSAGSPYPQPAWAKVRTVCRTRAVFVDLSPKTVSNAGKGSPSRGRTSMSAPPLVMSGAQLPCRDRLTADSTASIYSHVPIISQAGVSCHRC